MTISRHLAAGCGRWLRRSCSLLLAVWLLHLCSLWACGGEYEFRIKFPKSLHAENYTGRVYLLFTKNEQVEPRMGPNWFRPEPLLAVDVVDWKPEQPLVVGTSTGTVLLANPKPLAEMDLTGYRVQAVVRFNPWERVVGNGPGNGYSAAEPVRPSNLQNQQELLVNQLVAAPPFPENRWYQLLAVRSQLLSEFYGRDVYLRGSVILPASYHEATARRYPVIFEVPGFGGTHLRGKVTEPVAERNEQGVEFLRVTLDPSCPLGHHVFADSENNGPVGAALIREFIPEFDRQYRSVPESTARFVTGHSSGGWSSLWLQVAYPETFGGTWSTAPDPVDFHDFQRIDMYRVGENMYRDPAGNRRPLARQGDNVLLWYDDFDRTEETLGFGGQLHSFEAVFSPRGPTGKPLRAWDRKTGAVDLEVTRAWEKYDIRLLLERNWSQLGPRLAGKLHVFQGDLDTFYLDGATRRLQDSLKQLGSDAVVEMIPGKNHFNLIDDSLRLRMRSEMVRSFLQHQKP
jgi:Putative esterase